MKIKGRHIRNVLGHAGKIAKSIPIAVAAPIILDVAIELLPGSKLVKVAVKVGKAVLKTSR